MTLGQPEQNGPPRRLLIPPLPSSNAFGGADKENLPNSQTLITREASKPRSYAASSAPSTSTSPSKVTIEIGHGQLAAAGSSRALSLQRRLSDERDSSEQKRYSSESLHQRHGLTHRPSPAPRRRERLLPSSITTPLRTGIPVGRVIRSGETIDTLFCLGSDCDNEHRQLCEDIVNGDKADDEKLWRKVLEVASASMSQGKAGVSGKNLLRLHRRATSRIISRSVDDVNRKDFLAIWLSYARAMSSLGKRKEAASLYTYIQNQRLGDGDAAFFLSLAEFELSSESDHDKRENTERAIAVIHRGIKQRAEPTESLTLQLGSLQRQLEQNHSFPKKESKALKETSTKSIIPPMPSRAPVPSMRTFRKGNINPEVEGSQNDVKSSILKRSRPESHHQDSGKILKHRKFSSEKNTDQIQENGSTPVLDKENIPMHSVQDSLANDALSSSDEEDIITFNKPKVPTRNTDHRVEMAKRDAKLSSDKASADHDRGKRDECPHEDKSISDESSDETIPLGLNGTELMSQLPKIAPGRHADLPKFKRDVSGGSRVLEKLKSTNRQKTRNDGVQIKPSLRFDADLSKAKLRSRIAISKMSDKITRKTPLVSKKRLGGGAVRVDADDDTQNVSSSDDESSPSSTESSRSRPTDSDEKEDRKLPNTGIKVRKSVPKITKEDLGYMLNWNPATNRKQTQAETENGQSEKSMNPQGLDKIVEEPTIEAYANTGHSSSISTSSTATGSTTGNVSRKSMNDTKNNHSKGVESTIELTEPQQDSHQVQAQSNTMVAEQVDTQHNTTSPVALSEHLSLLAKSNADFLPLVTENNMLYVNNVPYAKLGVIGKGGSCKVYRALSKDCSVLAIKKVKLAGMDKKAIAGYANEIDLLKRLRGNPSIIQLYDSEVDLKRKAIFLSMEAGEVDLNYPSDIWSLGCILYQMVYGRTPFAEFTLIPKLRAIVDENHEISFPGSADAAAIDAIKLCLRRNPDERAPIVGENGLLNEHWFLNSNGGRKS
eukprot:scaffold68122_cov49-Attheya_sp.AAC.3